MNVLRTQHEDEDSVEPDAQDGVLPNRHVQRHDQRLEDLGRHSPSPLDCVCCQENLAERLLEGLVRLAIREGTLVDFVDRLDCRPEAVQAVNGSGKNKKERDVILIPLLELERVQAQWRAGHL